MKRLIATAVLILTLLSACALAEPAHVITEEIPEPCIAAEIPEEPEIEEAVEEAIEEAIEEAPEEAVGSCFPPPPPVIALTFDDGPSRYTEQILDVLEQHNVVATFFVLGDRLAAYRSTVERALNLGNEIANHTHTHARLTAATDCEVINEIQTASAAITEITGFSPLFYRPPFGDTDDRILGISADLGYGVIKWTIDPVDWRERDADIIYYRIMSLVEDGAVILLHDMYLSTAQAAERVIPSLIEQGFRFVTVSEFLDYRYGGLAAGDVIGSYDAIRMWD